MLFIVIEMELMHLLYCVPCNTMGLRATPDDHRSCLTKGDIGVQVYAGAQNI